MHVVIDMEDWMEQSNIHIEYTMRQRLELKSLDASIIQKVDQQQYPNYKSELLRTILITEKRGGRERGRGINIFQQRLIYWLSIFLLP